jgi:hypothetical protein
MSLAIRISHETQIRACREVPKLVRGHWEVQTYTICDGWINTWSIEENGVSKPETFATRDEAAKVLRDYMADCLLAVQDGDMKDVPSMEEFQIVFVEG